MIRATIDDYLEGFFGVDWSGFMHMSGANTPRGILVLGLPDRGPWSDNRKFFIDRADGVAYRVVMNKEGTNEIIHDVHSNGVNTRVPMNIISHGNNVEEAIMLEKYRVPKRHDYKYNTAFNYHASSSIGNIVDYGVISASITS